MIQFRDLTRLFIRSLRINKANKKKGRFFFYFLMLFCLLFIFIPFLLIIGGFIYTMTRDLNEVDFASIGFEVIISLVAFFIFVFSFNVLLNELYFSEDIENILPLPIKPELIASSKFVSCFIIENIFLFVILLYVCGVFLFTLKLPFTNLLISFIGMLLIPLAPMVYCAIISMAVIYLLRKIANKKLFKRLGYALVGLLVFGVAFTLYKLYSFDFENFIERFTNDNGIVLGVTRVVFPSIKYFVEGLYSGNILSVIISIIINIATFMVMFFLSKKLYLDGVLSLIAHDNSSRNSSKKLRKDFEVQSPVNSYLAKEFKILFRSPTFFINCILINIIWPIFLFLIIKFGFPTYTVSMMRKLMSEQDLTLLVRLLFMTIAVSIIVTTFNSIASSSYSREGKNYQFIKYIPMKYGVQWRVKLLVSILISFTGISFYMLIFYILIGTPIHLIFLYILISILCVLLVSYIGLLIDSCFPKIVWDDENDALRENYNCFIAMGFSLLFLGILWGVGYMLFSKHGLNFMQLISFSLGVLLITNIILYLISTSRISNFIRNQEV